MQYCDIINMLADNCESISWQKTTKDLFIQNGRDRSLAAFAKEWSK